MPPPNTPEEGLITSSSSTLGFRSFMSSDAPATALDLRALDYEDEVDENLICPICRVPFVSPVITTCDHVFCRKCITQAHALNPVCPIDRLPLKLVSETRPAPKIIFNQLDNLRVKCPNNIRGCSLVVSRSLIENHVARYCDQTLVPCPHPVCDKTTVRKDLGKGCLHYNLRADLEDHQDNRCPNRKKECVLCFGEYVRHKQEEHDEVCPQMYIPCKFAPFGCKQDVKRMFAEDHASMCDYRVVGTVGEQLAELRADIRILEEKDQLKDRRIKFLESRGFPYSSTNSPDPIPDIGLPESSLAHEAPYESRDQYFLSLFETMESKVERLSSAINEIEGRHSMMLFNESTQIKDQLTDIRSTMGVLGMHVRWLMNFRLQERGRLASPGLSGPIADNPIRHHDPPSLSGRLSDLREHPPRL
ncbi:hypothetical protein F5B19DRAFT_483907 [Rostrohypoxylon terebratum]|nr:hypothetical protein F5B19DRAFT_483907 [Rostrohypoxylon terebratum]